MELLRKTAVFRIEAQTKDKAPEEVAALSLSGVPILYPLIEPFTHLTHLYLVAMKPKLTTLTVLQLCHFPQLRLLDVSDNALQIEAPPTNEPCVALRRLLMPNNKIASTEEVQRLATAFPKLEILDLLDNAVMSSESFQTIFAMFPSLSALNSKTRDGEEVLVEDSDDSDSSDEEDESDEGDETDDTDEGTQSDVFSDDDDDEESSVEDEEDDSDDGRPQKKARAE